MLIYDKYTLNVCGIVKENLLDSVRKMSTAILDQFPISGSFNGVVLSRFVTLHTKCLKKC